MSPRLMTKLTFLAGLGLSACMVGAPAGPDLSMVHNPPQSQAGPACQPMIDQMKQATCAPLDRDADVHQTEGDPAARRAELEQLKTLQRAGMQSTCPGVDLEPVYAEMDRCLEDRLAEAKVEQAAQAKRLPAERKQVPAVKADPAYRAALERYRRAGADLADARADLEEEKRRGLDCARGPAEDCRRLDQLQARIGRHEAAQAAAVGELRDVLARHGIDRHDGPELGLW